MQSDGVQTGHKEMLSQGGREIGPLKSSASLTESHSR
jgi:hypothetical protein